MSDIPEGFKPISEQTQGNMVFRGYFNPKTGELGVSGFVGDKNLGFISGIPTKGFVLLKRLAEDVEFQTSSGMFRYLQE